MKTSPKPAVVVTTETHRPISPGENPVEVPPGFFGTNGARGVPQLDLLARLMDSMFEIPGTGIRFGFDTILGLVPGLGDAVASMVSLYILREASQRGVSKLTLARMAANIGVDYVVGSIPGVGDVFDVYWKANLKNIELLRQHTVENPTGQRRERASDWLFLAGLAALLICLLIGCLTITYFLVRWLGHQFGAAV